jgi:hypothetical protein
VQGLRSQPELGLQVGREGGEQQPLQRNIQVQMVEEKKIKQPICVNRYCDGYFVVKYSFPLKENFIFCVNRNLNFILYQVSKKFIQKQKRTSQIFVLNLKAHTVNKLLRNINSLFSSMFCVESKIVHVGTEKIVTLYK